MSQSQQRSSDWRRLFRIACDLIEQVNEDSLVIDRWTFGGGTAMLLQIDHRESHDIDIFLPDPQFLSFLNPDVRQFEFELMPSDHGGDGSRFARFSFKDIGEIDFIVAPSLTGNPTVARKIEGIETLLDTVPEIIAKKVVFRGGYIKPRDIFDIAAAGRVCGDETIAALSQFRTETQEALSAMEKLNPDFVKGAVAQLMIRERFKDLVEPSLEKAKELLSEAL